VFEGEFGLPDFAGVDRMGAVKGALGEAFAVYGLAFVHLRISWNLPSTAGGILSWSAGAKQNRLSILTSHTKGIR
jgi:hypothetical protein